MCQFAGDAMRPHWAATASGMMATTLHLHHTIYRSMCRNRRGPGVVGALARVALATWVAAAMLAPLPVAHACGYHDPTTASVGMLNWAYPDALHVRTAVWIAQSSGLLAPREPGPALDPSSAVFRLQQMARWRETQSRLGAVQGRIQAALDGRPMPSFAMVLIGPMLWTRYESAGDSVNMVLHDTGPRSDDVVIVTDEAVVAALTEGRITPRNARAAGLVKTYGTRESVARLSALLDRSFQLQESPMSQTHGSREAP